MKSNVRHSLRTAYICEEVHKFRTKIKLLENSGELHQVRLHTKTIEGALKNTTGMDGNLS